MSGTLSVELAGSKVDVGGSVAVHPGLRLDAGGAGVAGVKGNCKRMSGGIRIMNIRKKSPTCCNFDALIETYCCSRLFKEFLQEIDPPKNACLFES
eukprot:747477-Hanusia_phi.AAC.2